MPRTVVFLRHTETPWNAKGRFNSTTDIELTTAGAAHATAAASHLARLEPFGFLRSDARRADETAAPLVHLVGRPPEVDPRFAEVNFGPFEGRLPAAVTQDPAFRSWHRGDETTADGPEALEAAADRAEAGFLDALERHAGASTLVIVSHRMLLRVLLCRVVLELPANAYRRLALYNTRAALVKLGDGDPRLRLAAMHVSASDLDVPDA